MSRTTGNKKGGVTAPFFIGSQSTLIRQRRHGLELFIELHGEALTTHRQNLEGVFMHPQLSISNLHATHELLELIGKRIEVVAVSLKRQDRIVVLD